MNSCETAYREMFDAWSAGEYAHALEVSREVLQKYPDHHVAWVLQGVILYELARYDEAERVLNEAVRCITPDSLDHGYHHLGHLHLRRGNYEQAEKWYRKAVELRPDDAGRHIFLGALLAQRGDFRGAEAAHRKATECSRGARDEAWLNLGLVLRAQERYEEALASFKRALELSPDYKEASTAKADIEKAIAYLQKLA